MNNILDVVAPTDTIFYMGGGSWLTVVLGVACLLVIAGACAGLVFLLRKRSKEKTKEEAIRNENPKDFPDTEEGTIHESGVEHERVRAREEEGEKRE